MVLKNKTYDALKWIAQYLLPALTTLWLALGKIWAFPYTTEIGASLAAIDVFLGAILGISSHNYEGDGTMVVNTTDPEKDVYTLEYEGDLNDIAAKKSVTFKVVNGDEK